jgi:hypothetical protein
MIHWYDREVGGYDVGSLIFFAIVGPIALALIVAVALGFLWVLIYHPVWLGVAAFVLGVVAFVFWVSWMRSF